MIRTPSSDVRRFNEDAVRSESFSFFSEDEEEEEEEGDPSKDRGKDGGKVSFWGSLGVSFLLGTAGFCCERFPASPRLIRRTSSRTIRRL